MDVVTTHAVKIRGRKNVPILYTSAHSYNHLQEQEEEEKPKT